MDQVRNVGGICLRSASNQNVVGRLEGRGCSYVELCHQVRNVGGIGLRSASNQFTKRCW